MTRHPLLVLIVFGCTACLSAGEAKAPPKELILNLGNGVGMQLVLIPAGRFTMGSKTPSTKPGQNDGPVHEVTISKPFYLAIHEVTREQYGQVAGGSNEPTDRGRLPQGNFSWFKAMDFCEQLTARTGRTALLPTEAQWEYAARAGSSTRFCFGDDPAMLVEYGWTRANTYDDQGKLKNRTVTIREVGKAKANAWGLYDMYGNHWEWCADWYGDYTAAAAIDPTGAESGKRRIVRGGSYYFDAGRCNSSARHAYVPTANASGFRVVVLVE